MREILLGGNSGGVLLAFIVLGMIGTFANLAIHVSKGIKDNYHSPEKFDWKYFWVDNWLRIFLTPIAVYFLAIGGNQIPQIQTIIGDYPWVSAIYLGIGFYSDKLIAKI